MPLLACAGAVVLAALLPVLGFVPFHFQFYSTVVEHYLYLAMLGPALALTWALRRFDGVVARVACAAMLVALATRAWSQTWVWHDSLSMFAPHTPTLRYLLADELLHDGDDGEAAAAQCRAGLLDNPRHSGLLYDMGRALEREGRLDLAAMALATAVHQKPDFGAARAELLQARAEQALLETASGLR